MFTLYRNCDPISFGGTEQQLRRLLLEGYKDLLLQILRSFLSSFVPEFFLTTTDTIQLYTQVQSPI